MSDETEHLNISVAIGNASFSGDGSAERVMAALEKFTAMLAEHGGLPSAPAAPTSTTAGTEGVVGTTEAPNEGATPTPPQDSAASKVPLPKFLERPEIKGNSKVATAIVIWAADHDSRDGLSKGDIEKSWKGTKLKVPANTSRDIGDAVRAGWLIKDGRIYSASGFGREAIGLPAS